MAPAVATANDGQYAEKPAVHAQTVQPNAKPLIRPPLPNYDGVDPLVVRQELKEKLAAAFRIFSKYGFDEGVAGHITVRDPVMPHHFWVNPFGLHFGLIKASDLILVDAKGTVVAGGALRLLNTAAFMIHSAIHTARPDVVCAAHSHSIYGRTFSAFGRELDMTTQDTCNFWRDHTVYPSFNGVVLEAEEGIRIAEVLGTKKAVLLQNHGILTVGGTIEATVFLFLSMEKCCQTQLLLDAAAAGRGTPFITIEEEEAEFTYQTIASPRSNWFGGVPLFQMIEKETGGDYKG